MDFYHISCENASEGCHSHFVNTGHTHSGREFTCTGCGQKISVAFRVEKEIGAYS
jgi:hypothetical protein